MSQTVNVSLKISKYNSLFDFWRLSVFDSPGVSSYNSLLKAILCGFYLFFYFFKYF